MRASDVWTPQSEGRGSGLCVAEAEGGHQQVRGVQAEVGGAGGEGGAAKNSRGRPDVPIVFLVCIGFSASIINVLLNSTKIRYIYYLCRLFILKDSRKMKYLKLSSFNKLE